MYTQCYSIHDYGSNHIDDGTFATGRSHKPGKSNSIFANLLLHPVTFTMKKNDKSIFGINCSTNNGNIISKSSLEITNVSYPTTIITAINDALVHMEVMTLR